MAIAYGRQLLTLDQLQVVGDLLQDGEAGQHQAVGASQPSMLTPIWPVPLAALHHQHSKKLLLCPFSLHDQDECRCTTGSHRAKGDITLHLIIHTCRRHSQQWNLLTPYLKHTRFAPSSQEVNPDTLVWANVSKSVSGAHFGVVEFVVFIVAGA